MKNDSEDELIDIKFMIEFLNALYDRNEEHTPEL
jgi:hypothetical protein